ncbi:hypothetical protein ACIA8J_03215 [Streptomyces asoensis]|uniref:hypothetical protein n=1 Tax=Streptomyces asoensis TaxID=249586 RepID=UPI0037A202F5
MGTTTAGTGRATPVVGAVRFEGEDVPFGCGAAEFVCRALTDPHQRFTLAEYFDTHWFMNCREPR